MLLKLYKTVLQLSTPFLEAYLQKRLARGKEDAARACERRGQPQRQRGSAPLIWFHAASVGESLSLLVVIERILKDYPGTEAVVTTGTVTSATLMAKRLPPRAFHQYMTVDHPDWVEKFLDHWRPDFVVWSESEFWPNTLQAIKARGIPAILLNARMSEKSFSRWKMFPKTIQKLLSTFSLCLGQNEAETQRLAVLGALKVKTSGNIKYAAAPLPFDAASLERLKQDTAGRKIVLYASTHHGEEEIAFGIHQALKTECPELLTIIVPRHPVRGPDIAVLAAAEGLPAALRSDNESPSGKDVYIADTMGELGLFYRLAKLAVIGGSFADIGGHNPIEPGQTGCIISYGPMMYNFVSINEDFLEAGAAIQVNNADELKKILAQALASPEKFSAYAQAAQKLTEEKSSVVDGIMRDITPLLQSALSTNERRSAS